MHIAGYCLLFAELLVLPMLPLLKLHVHETSAVVAATGTNGY